MKSIMCVIKLLNSTQRRLDMLASKVFSKFLIVKDFEFYQLGRAGSSSHNTCTYLYDGKYAAEINQNPAIVGVVTKEEFASRLDSRLGLVICEDPSGVFFSAFNDLALERSDRFKESSVDETAFISSRAIIDVKGVVIGGNTIIEDCAVIKSGTIIGSNCVVRSGVVIGGEGFEVKKIHGKDNIVAHDGRVVIGNNVEIQYNSCIDKGLLGRDTVIADDVKIDNLVHIAHGVHVGSGTKIAAGATVAGRAEIGHGVWIGPGCTISNAVSIADNAKVTLGSCVVSNVVNGATVSGYFAIEHTKFLAAWRKLRSLIR